MAKYTITFSCGHTETVQLFGKIKERESYIEWAEKKGKCHACKAAEAARQRAKEHEHNVAKAVMYDLPQLEGSDKQVSWAIDIRQKMIAILEECCKGHSFELLADKWKSADEETKNKMLNAARDTYANYLASIFTETNAKFYIDNHRYL